MKAKKPKPIPKQQQSLLVGRDYLSLLIRQLDLEIHVTNMIFKKFINPKVKYPFWAIFADFGLFGPILSHRFSISTELYSGRK